MTENHEKRLNEAWDVWMRDHTRANVRALFEAAIAAYQNWQPAPDPDEAAVSADGGEKKLWYAADVVRHRREARADERNKMAVRWIRFCPKCCGEYLNPEYRPLSALCSCQRVADEREALAAKLRNSDAECAALRKAINDIKAAHDEESQRLYENHRHWERQWKETLDAAKAANKGKYDEGWNAAIEAMRGALSPYTTIGASALENVLCSLRKP